jgi:hypothetical protein
VAVRARIDPGPLAGSTPRLRLAASPTVVLAVLAAVTAAVVTAWSIQPTSSPGLSYDAYASTLHFDRLVSGHRLEDVLGTTPKPLLTLAFGVAHALGGWSLVAVVSLAAWVVSVGLATALAARLGGAAAGVAMAVLLIVSPTLLLDTAWGQGSVWAIGAWAGAGLAVTARRPRWILCGFLLGLGALARPETMLIGFLALALAVGLRLIGRKVPRGAVGAALLSFWCLPVMLLHDWALTGDPLYWSRVSQIYGDALASIGALPGPGDAANLAVSPAVQAPIIAVLAVAGALLLARRRSWAVLTGMVALAAGVLVGLPALAALGRLADSRYLEPFRVVMDLGAAVAIAAAFAAVVARLRGSLAGRRGTVDGRLVAGLGVVVAAVVAVAVSPVLGPLDAGTQSIIARFRSFSRSADLALPSLQAVSAANPAIAVWPGTKRLATGRPDVFAVPGNIRPRLALDLHVPLTRLVATSPYALDIAEGQPPVGEVVLHSAGDVPQSAYAVLEGGSPMNVGIVVLTPLFSDAADGTWVVRIDSVGFGSPIPQPVPR